ncbi:GNAT family N-acetyltransferase [Nonomuraea sp. NPDC050536]|uniref:GNAT family N-acetyltransferase n=1 Tax=Nonomuraea sp. NPDC050536 TaxID=3364366 RepID=UPI0037C80810
MLSRRRWYGAASRTRTSRRSWAETFYGCSGRRCEQARPRAGGAMSDVAIRELHDLDEFNAVLALFTEIWGSTPGNEPVTVEQMRALTHAGNYVTGAYRDGRLVGAAVGFFSAPVGTSLHSHVTGALPGYGAGYLLKLHQREWALARGLERITWTFDPLIRRNAYFNLAKLGGLPEEYLPRFYGSIHDEINGGDDTDRVLVGWHLTETRVGARVPEDARVALCERDGRPVIGTMDAKTLLVETPPDIEALRHTDPGAAQAWRLALREVLGGLLLEGARVTGFHDKSSYVVTRPS